MTIVTMSLPCKAKKCIGKQGGLEHEGRGCIGGRWRVKNVGVR